MSQKIKALLKANSKSVSSYKLMRLIIKLHKLWQVCVSGRHWHTLDVRMLDWPLEDWNVYFPGMEELSLPLDLPFRFLRIDLYFRQVSFKASHDLDFRKEHTVPALAT